MTPISKTGLDYINISPKDYYHRFLRPDRELYLKTKDQIFDEALRCRIFTPDIFTKTYVKTPDFDLRKPFDKAEKKAMQAAADKSGQILLSASEYDKIQLMTNEIKKHTTASILTSLGTIGKPSVFEELNTGVEISYRPHWTYKNSIIYLSSTDDATASGFSKQALDLKLHKRAAIQIDATGIHSFIFIVIEKKSPFKIGVHTLDDRSVNLGRHEYIENCRVYSECLKDNNWPGLTEKIQPVSLPEWVFK